MEEGQIGHLNKLDFLTKNQVKTKNEDGGQEEQDKAVMTELQKKAGRQRKRKLDKSGKPCLKRPIMSNQKNLRLSGMDEKNYSMKKFHVMINI